MQEQAGFWLSPQQANLWAAQEQGACNAISLMEFGVNAGETQVREALRAVVARHEALRTVFRSVPGMKVPFQVVLPESDFVWSTVSLAGMPADEQTRQLETLFEGERSRSFDLRQGPIVSALWIALGETRNALLLSLPSLLSDVPSLDILHREIRAILQGEELPESALRYVQFAQWQRELLTSIEDDPERENAKSHWDKVREVAANPTLPEDRLVEGDSHPEFVSVSLDRPALDQVERAAEKHAVSLEIFLLAAWESLVRRLTGQASFVTGMFFAGREYEELHDLVGTVGRTVPMQTDFEENKSFHHVLQHLRESYRQAASWQEYYAPEASFPVCFDYAEHSDQRFLRAESHSEPCLLRLSARRGKDLVLEFGFDPSQLRRETVQRWSGNFVTLLRGAAENPASDVGALPWLSEQERRLALVDWNKTEKYYPRHRTFHECFEEQAARTPDRTAVQCGENRLTYRELNENSNRLAHALRGLGVTAGAPVGMCVDRGEKMIVALLGILKAGGAYVPLSVEHPKPRLAQQLTGASLLLTEERFLAQMPEFSGKTLCFDQPGWWKDQPAANPLPAGTAENLVYIIYTSGSTGVPKGVGVRHRNLVNYTWFIRNLLRLETFPEGLHFGLVSTLSADLGNTCIFPSLISGGCLHVIPQEMTTDSESLAAYCRKNPIDVLKIVPSHLSALLESDRKKDLLPRKYLITGGELLSKQLAERVTGLAPSCELINHYGPTETTVGSLTLRLKDYDWKNSTAKSIPIGRPIANTRVYILDSHGQPLPVGVAGELFIAGDGVASGYVGRQELTDERFVREVFQDDPARKMYRTGDLARYLDDGCVEFLGRSDDQVKIRGFRIELSEIESVAMRFAAVKRAVVLARADERGDLRLVAWVVNQPDQQVHIEELRTHLRANLPDYMVPAAFVALARLPLNSNGKVDRMALPSPEESESAKRAYVAPVGPVEEGAAAIWADVLRLDRIGAEDDFFEIGGHSLLATRIVSRLREQFQVSVTVRMVFERPTIRQLALAIEAARLEAADDEEEEIVALGPAGAGSKQDPRG